MPAWQKPGHPPGWHLKSYSFVSITGVHIHPSIHTLPLIFIRASGMSWDDQNQFLYVVFKNISSVLEDTPEVVFGCYSSTLFWHTSAFFSYFPSNGFLTAAFPLKTLLLMPWQTMGDAFPRSCDGSMLHLFLLLEDMIFKCYLSALEFFLGILLSSPFPAFSVFFKTHFMPC